MTGNLKKITFIGLLGLSSAYPVITLAQQAPVVGPAQVVSVYRAIDVKGNKRISADTIRTYSGLLVNIETSPGDINAALQRLNATGLFSNISIVPSGGRLVISVVENPTINAISIEGNRRLDDDVLLPALTIQPRAPYSPIQAEQDAKTILAIYAQSGRVASQVTPQIIKRSDNRVDVVFKVNEGKVVEIQDVSFVGNKAFRDRRLRRVIETQEAGLFSQFFKNDTFDAARLDYDRQLLQEFYLSRGFVDVQVLASSAELSKARDAYFVSFNISEGQRYRFGNVEVISDFSELDATKYNKLLRIKPGKYYDNRLIDNAIEAVNDEIARDGYPFFHVQPRVQKDETNQIVSIDFEITQGPKVFIERIDIQGNTTTLDRVIRRQFDVVEGDAFNTHEIRQATDRIRSLGYFEDVQVNSREGSTSSQAVVDVDLEEKSTGQLSLGAAYSSSSGAAFTLGISENNWLGRGQTLSSSISIGGEDKKFDFAFIEPELFDRDLAAGFRLYYSDFSRQSESSYSVTKYGFEPFLEFPLTEDSRLRLSYRLSSDDIVDVSPDASSLIVAEQGEKTTSLLGFAYSLDKRNSRVDPTAGTIFTLSESLAGLGGDVEYSKTVAKVKTYRSFLSEEVILSGELEGGYIHDFGDGARITDRFFLGGDSFRGFERSGLGPRDLSVENEDSLGGNIYTVARGQVSFPIGLHEKYGVYGGLFANVGSVWDLDNNLNGAIDDSRKVRAAVGATIFWDTSFGPLRFDFSKAVKKEDYDREQSFSFSIETRF